MTDEITVKALFLLFVIVALVALLIPLSFVVLTVVREAVKEVYELFWRDRNQ